MSASNVTLPNPYTPMAFIPPEAATRLTNELYAAVGTVTVLIWDIILHLPQDYKLATEHRINYVFVIYCIARLASLAWVLGVVIVTTSAVGNCDYVRQINILYPFTIPLTVIPLLIRVFALYNYNKYVVAFFSTTWLSVLGACIVVPIGSFGIRIGTTDHCDHGISNLANNLSIFCPFIHDTFAFAATSWALMVNSHRDVGVKNGIDVMVLGKHLPPFSKSILRDGQAYYLVILIFKLFVVVVAYIPETVKIPCTFSVVIVSNMCSYVYRNMRLGLYRDYTITSSAINRAVQGPGHAAHPRMVFNRNPILKRQNVEGDVETGDIASQEEERQAEE